MEEAIAKFNFEIHDSLPQAGQLAFYNNRIWKVTEIHGNTIMHLQRPRHHESISLFGKQILSVKTITEKAHEWF